MYSSIEAEDEACVCAIKNKEATSEEDFSGGGYCDRFPGHCRVMSGWSSGNAFQGSRRKAKALPALGGGWRPANQLEAGKNTYSSFTSEVSPISSTLTVLTIFTAYH